MKHYKLINTQTSEEHLCNKITIDGFDYYVGNIAIKFKYGISKLNEIVEILLGYDATLYKGIICTNNPNIDIPKVVDDFKYDYDKLGKSMITDALVAFEKEHGYSLQTKEERDLTFKETGRGGDYLYYRNYTVDNNFVYLHYEEHTRHDRPYSVTLELPLKSFTYPKLKKSQETHPNSNEDMIEFLDFSKSTNKEKSLYEMRCLLEGKPIDSKKLLQLWKEQKSKIIYYE